MPLSLDQLGPLAEFDFDASLCEPKDPAFEAWFSHLKDASPASLCSALPWSTYLPLLATAD